ncbi:MAG: hypothetical protein QGG64_26080 [Candidatus Latescibacteria bacterium]|jgi:hypothetical protein|nr:hypothetical protein [Candidatus Latescibacterota bacterium]
MNHIPQKSQAIKKGREHLPTAFYFSFRYKILNALGKPHFWTGGDNNIGGQIDAKNTKSYLQKRSSNPIP